MQQQEQPQVSIIVPVYNAGEFLERSLGSILAQTYQNWECWVVDDGSTDGSGALCDEWAAKDARFKVIHKQNGGVSSARNAALEMAAGQFLMFCDQDDALDIHAMEYALEMQKASPDALVTWAFTREDQIFTKTKEEPLEYKEYAMEQVAWRTDWFHTVWNRLFYMDTVRENSLRFDENLGWSDRLGEDIDFSNQYMQKRYQSTSFFVLRSEQPRYFYFPDNPDSVTVNIQQAAARELPKPIERYWKKILEEYADTRPQQLEQLSIAEQQSFVLHYLRCFAFGVWSSKQLKETLPKELWNSRELKHLLGHCKQKQIYSVYYLPIKWKMRNFICNIYEWDETCSPVFYQVKEILYRLFFYHWMR